MTDAESHSGSHSGSQSHRMKDNTIRVSGADVLSEYSFNAVGTFSPRCKGF